MIRSNRKPRNRSEQMILNNYRAMQRVRSLTDKALTPGLLLELHRSLTAKTLDDPSAVGRFRTADEPVEVATPYNEVLHTPPPAEQLETRLKALCDFANEGTPTYFVHPVIRSVILHFWLAYDHPFVDGNGRCARALFYWSMLRRRYWLCEFISISQIIKRAPARYGRAFLYT
ncbi:MAG: Fic family protein, partial [Phycisphaerae bacterium]